MSSFDDKRYMSIQTIQSQVTLTQYAIICHHMQTLCKYQLKA